MSRFAVVVRFNDVSGALERVLGLLRRRALPVEALSVYRISHGVGEMALRLGELSTPPERVVAELEGLVDVVSVRRLTARCSEDAREMALASTRGEVGPWPPSDHGQLVRRGHGAVEVSGTPEEIDRALELMRERRILTGSARTGEILPPVQTHPPRMHITTTPGDESDGAA